MIVSHDIFDDYGNHDLDVILIRFILVPYLIRMILQLAVLVFMVLILC